MLSKKGQCQDFRLIAVQFEEVLLHLCLNVCKAGSDSGVGSCCFGGEMELSVVYPAVDTEAMKVDLSQDVHNEQEGT